MASNRRNTGVRVEENEAANRRKTRVRVEETSGNAWLTCKGGLEFSPLVGAIRKMHACSLSPSASTAVSTPTSTENLISSLYLAYTLMHISSYFFFPLVKR